MIESTSASESNLNDLVSEMKQIINQSGDLNIHKDSLTNIIQQVDFLLGKHDDVYNTYIDLFVAMGQLDFSKRLPLYTDGGDFVNFINNGINMLNEEFKANVISKRVFHDFINGVGLNDTLVVVTGSDGFIDFAHSGETRLTDFGDKFLVDQGIQILFEDFSVIHNRIKNEGTIKKIKVNFKWKNQVFPAIVDVILSAHFGNIESIIYIIKLN